MGSSSPDRASFTSSLGITTSHYFPVLSAEGANFDLCFPESNPLFNAVGKVEMKYTSQETFPVWKRITAVTKPSNRNGFCYTHTLGQGGGGEQIKDKKL